MLKSVADSKVNEVRETMHVYVFVNMRRLPGAGVGEAVGASVGGEPV